MPYDVFEDDADWSNRGFDIRSVTTSSTAEFTFVGQLSSDTHFNLITTDNTFSGIYFQLTTATQIEFTFTSDNYYNQILNYLPGSPSSRTPIREWIYPSPSGTTLIENVHTTTYSQLLQPGYYGLAIGNGIGPETASVSVDFLNEALFTAGPDTVNFNLLQPSQQAAIASGANIYQGLGGSDSVTLPTIANYNISLGNPGGTLGWNPGSTFQTGSLAGNKYSVTGSDGSYKVALGAGPDTVTINGNGNSTITAGPGAATITINGSGVNTINLGAGTANITLTGSNNAIDFFTPNETAVLNLQSGFKELVNGFTSGDVIDLKNFGDLTLSAGVTRSGTPASGEVDLYSGTRFVGTLIFNNSVDYKLLKPVSDGSGGTKIVVDAAPGPQDPGGTQINWTFIHQGESPKGITVLRPYVSTGLSGLTMAQGVDIGGLGNNGTNFFNQVFPDWQSNPNLTFISSFVGKSHDQALTMLQPQATIGGNPSSLSVSLTTTEANAITLATETAIYNKLSADYTAAAAQYGQGGWNTLTANQQTGIYDVAYNFGVVRFEALHLWPLLAQHRWNDAVVGTNDATGVYFLGGQKRGSGVAERRIEDGALILDGTSVAIAPHLETGTKVANKTVYNFTVGAPSDHHAIDPAGPYLTLVSDPGSPKINSLTLPLLGDASHYLISYETGSAWSQPQLHQPGDVVHFDPSGVDGLKVTMLDADNHPVQGSSEFTFYVTFASTGTYSGVVTSLGGNTHDNFGGDGVSDILFHNNNGITAIYDMHADGSSNAVQLGTIDPAWKIEDTGKYGSGSDGDILWRNVSSGQIVTWSITAGEKTPGYTDLGTFGPQWQIQTHNGSSDFTGDGADDILLRNSSSNELVFWNMQGGKAVNTVDLGTAPNSQWDISGTSDFNGDGKADILWHNNVTGDAFIWASGGTGPTTQLGTINPTWTVVGVGDFKGDGVDDILWFNTSSHQAVYWDDHANGTSTLVDLGITPNGFTFDKPRDLTGDGTADFLLHNSTTGMIVSAANDGGTVHAFHVIDTLPTSWHII